MIRHICTKRVSSLSGRRPAVAAVWAVVVLAVMSALLSTVTVQLLSNRHVLDRHQESVQSLWLARAGIELASERLLAEPTPYEGETAQIIPQSRIRIEVRPEKGATDMFLVTSEARYPAGVRQSSVHTLTRHFRRIVEKGQVRLEAVATKSTAEEDAAKPVPTKK